jgi:hypothetical protein
VAVHLRRLDLSTPDGEVKVAVDGSCLDVDAGGHSQKVCQNEIVSAIAGLGGSSFGHVTAAQQTALQHLFAGVTDLGIVTSQTGGAWYVNPVRTYSTLAPSLLSHLQGDDLFQLISLGR